MRHSPAGLSRWDKAHPASKQNLRGKHQHASTWCPPSLSLSLSLSVRLSRSLSLSRYVLSAQDQWGCKSDSGGWGGNKRSRRIPSGHFFYDLFSQHTRYDKQCYGVFQVEHATRFHSPNSSPGSPAEHAILDLYRRGHRIKPCRSCLFLRTLARSLRQVHLRDRCHLFDGRLAHEQSSRGIRRHRNIIGG